MGIEPGRKKGFYGGGGDEPRERDHHTKCIYFKRIYNNYCTLQKKTCYRICGNFVKRTEDPNE